MCTSKRHAYTIDKNILRALKGQQSPMKPERHNMKLEMREATGNLSKGNLCPADDRMIG
ncbi:MAG: hypothetical protein Q7S15_01895 [bacterium]|nr:hypothetical protein [bacterium]